MTANEQIDAIWDMIEMLASAQDWDSINKYLDEFDVTQYEGGILLSMFVVTRYEECHESRRHLGDR